MCTSKVTVLVAGTDARGEIYSYYMLEHPDRMQVVDVAEPKETYRQQFVAQHKIDLNNVFCDRQEAAAQPRMADVALICTQDNVHKDLAVAFANFGYHILLEKPLTPTPRNCRIIIDAVKRNNVLLAVARILRYTRCTQKLKSLLGDGAIGSIVSIQHLELVSYWHQARLFVRGNWHSKAESSLMLSQKSHRDLGWVRYITNDNCQDVGSFGSLSHFVRENQPVGTSDRCLDCQVESACPWSACKIYLGESHKCTPRFRRVLTADPNGGNVRQALRDGPCGRCVHRCNNDVMDHQAVNLRFAHQQTMTFTMTVFTKTEDRRTCLFGTKGYLESDGEQIRVFNFLTDRGTVHRIEEIAAGTQTQMGRHGDGGYYLMDRLIRAVMTNSQSMILSGPGGSLESHLMVFATERVHKKNRLVTL